MSEDIPPQLQKSYQLHKRLEVAGAYERLRQLDPRRATLLQSYLTTEKPLKEVAAEVGMRSRTHAQELLNRSMEVAFYALPAYEREEYDNNPATALQTRSALQTETKRKRITKANLKRWQLQRTLQANTNDLPEQPTPEGTLGE